MVTPGLVVYGYVRLESMTGTALAGVQIHRYFAGYAPGPVVATTDAEGYYETAFVHIPGDEMVTVWPELIGYTFVPPQYTWRHYYGYERARRDFVAIPAVTLTPTATETPTATPTASPTSSPTPTATRWLLWLPLVVRGA